MDAQRFLGIEPVSDDRRWWRLRVTPAISTPGRFLFGGCGLAAGIVAIEGAAKRPTVWAAAQYLAHAPVGAELRWQVTLAAVGRATTQARAVAVLGDAEVLTVNAALGQVAEPDVADQVFAAPPEVPPPGACPPQDRLPFPGETVFARVEQRLAGGRAMAELDGQPSEGRSAWWFRVPGHLEPSAATLAVLGDYVTGGVSHAVGVPTGSRSLDNTIRVVRLVPTEWILADVAIDATVGGFAHGRANLFAEDGTLLATASQSMSVRRWTPERMAQLARAMDGRTEEPAR
ncbi:acyl-CoA thioesterase [Aciditerrimonas ferrireducens]|uniref:acyl-CoA thioesterase n=1 Tax=Aciditerrimonas ferrireducens TaxID=667306 RepID=UPI002003871D|nr:acyl-CoA thioesterase domain-containing protein [Aciditerrimonas ferrireducens]MCK4176212.1 thioesterase family protein [Aciditerrimonas ferrireducens]